MPDSLTTEASAKATKEKWRPHASAANVHARLPLGERMRHSKASSTSTGARSALLASTPKTARAWSMRPALAQVSVTSSASSSSEASSRAQEKASERSVSYFAGGKRRMPKLSPIFPTSGVSRTSSAGTTASSGASAPRWLRTQASVSSLTVSASPQKACGTTPAARQASAPRSTATTRSQPAASSATSAGELGSGEPATSRARMR